MSYAFAPILVGVTSPVSEILLLSKTAKFPFPTMDYSPWSSKNLIDRNRLKKFMHIRIDVTCMRTNFGGRGLSIFGVMASFCLPSKMAKISLRTMGYSPWSSKNLIDRNRLKKFMHIRIDVTCMHAHQFWWAWSLHFRSYGFFLLAFKNGQNFPSDHGL